MCRITSGAHSEIRLNGNEKVFMLYKYQYCAKLYPVHDTWLSSKLMFYLLRTPFLVPADGGNLRGEGTDWAGPSTPLSIWAALLSPHSGGAWSCALAACCNILAAWWSWPSITVPLLLDWTLRRWALARPSSCGSRVCWHSGLEAVCIQLYQVAFQRIFAILVKNTGCLHLFPIQKYKNHLHMHLKKQSCKITIIIPLKWLRLYLEPW